MKKNILKLVFLSILLASNYLFFDSIISLLSLSKTLNTLISLFVIILVILYSGWVFVVDKKSKLWLASGCGAIIYFIGEGVLKASYYFFMRNIFLTESQLNDAYISGEFFVLLFWGFVFSPVAALIAALGGMLKLYMLKRENGRNEATPWV